MWVPHPRLAVVAWRRSARDNAGVTASQKAILLAVVFAAGVGLGSAARRYLGSTQTPHQTEHSSGSRDNAPSMSKEAVSHPNENELAAASFPDRLDAILAMPNRYKRLRAIMAVADNLGSDEIHDALVRLEKVHFQERDKLLFVLLHRWGELDPKAALDYARKIKADDRSSAVTHVIKGWCESDPAAAEA